MATWNSTPSVPHTGGTFNFPQNTTNNDIVYTIRYTDDNGCTASTTYTVPPCDCSVYKFSTITRPVTGHTTTSIAWSIDSLEQLTYTIMSSGGFLTGITVVHTGDRWQYMGVFNTTTSTSDRTATIEYKNSDGTCVFPQELVMKGETDCSAYGFTARTTSLSSDEATNVLIAETSGFSSVPDWDGNPTWLNGPVFMPPSQGNPIIISHLDPYTDGQSRTGVAKFTTSDGCVFEATITQSGPSVFTVDPIIYISADGGTAHGNVISTIGGEPVGFSINNSTLQCPSYNGWTVVANTSNSRIDVTAGSTSSSKECGSIQVVQNQTGRYAVFKIIQSAPTAKDITINLIPSEDGSVYTSNYYGRTWYVNWKLYYRYDSSKTAIASGTIGYENKSEGQQATYSSAMHIPNLSMPLVEYYVDFTTTMCSIYTPNHQPVTPPSICYEGEYVTTYETDRESLEPFYSKGTFNIYTSFK